MKNTDDAVKEMKKVINETIRIVYELSQDEKLTALWREECARLDGQEEMLSILTGKMYIRTKDGLIEFERRM